MLKATVNTQTFDIQLDNTEISVNSQPFKWDMVEIKMVTFIYFTIIASLMRRFWKLTIKQNLF